MHTDDPHYVLVKHFRGDRIANSIVAQFPHYGSGAVLRYRQSVGASLKGLELKHLILRQRPPHIAFSGAINKPQRHIWPANLRPVGNFTAKDSGKIAKGQVPLKGIISAHNNGNFFSRNGHLSERLGFFLIGQRSPQGRQVKAARLQRL